jgi:hypothetical protein
MPRDFAALFFERLHTGTPVTVVGSTLNLARVRKAIPILTNGRYLLAAACLTNCARQSTEGRLGFQVVSARNFMFALFISVIPALMPVPRMTSFHPHSKPVRFMRLLLLAILSEHFADASTPTLL